MVESKTDYLLNKKYTSGNSYYSSVQNEIFDSGKIKIQKEISPKKVGQESELKIQKVERIERVERIEIVEKIEKVKDNGSIASS